MNEPPSPSNDSSDPLADETPIVGKIIDEASNESASATAELTASELANDGEIRVGSPFAKDPDLWDGVVVAPRQPEKFYDVGPLKYTAMGAVAASVMVLAFSGAAAWWFPGGGTLIAALGCALSIFGLYSHYRFIAAGCLGLHMLLFIFSYSRAIMA